MGKAQLYILPLQKINACGFCGIKKKYVKFLFPLSTSASIGGEDKESKAKAVGTEPPELMGPAHSAHKLGLMYPNHPKSSYWEGAALVAAKGRINSLKPEGHFPFVCSVLSPWLL